jgi:uncharacterized membrane protein YcaP (DUF421 family)
MLVLPYLLLPTINRAEPARNPATVTAFAGPRSARMTWFDDVFGTGPQLIWWQECARALVVFCYGLVLVRAAGRRVFGKWAALDIVVAIVVGSNLSRALTGNAALLGTLVATTLLMALHWALAHGAARSARLSQLLEGRSVRLGEGGRVEAAALARHAVSEADLHEALHGAGLEGASGARLIVLEPSGKLSVLKGR